MPRSAKKDKELNRIAKEMFVYTFILLLLALTAANLNNYLQPKKTLVLAAETQDTNEGFWDNFLQQNPDYIPGWIELGRLDKVREIDPNYPTP